MFFLLYKDSGISSFKFIQRFARENNIKKIGHTGTLDPLAEGLLLIATNESTKLIEYVKENSKTYLVTAYLGVRTDTFDVEGQEIDKNNNMKVICEDVELVLASFLGKQNQTPPAFSAKNINGERAYKLARQGKNIYLAPTIINVESIKLIKCDLPFIYFKITVSKGAYVRSIVDDLGIKLGTFAVMTHLRRIAIGGLVMENLFEFPISEKKILNLKEVEVKQEDFNKLANGQKIFLENNFENGDKKFMATFKNKVIAICRVESGFGVPEKVLVQQQK